MTRTFKVTKKAQRRSPRVSRYTQSDGSLSSHSLSNGDPTAFDLGQLCRKFPLEIQLLIAYQILSDVFAYPICSRDSDFLTCDLFFTPLQDMTLFGPVINKVLHSQTVWCLIEIQRGYPYSDFYRYCIPVDGKKLPFKPTVSISISHSRPYSSLEKTQQLMIPLTADSCVDIWCNIAIDQFATDVKVEVHDRRRFNKVQPAFVKAACVYAYNVERVEWQGDYSQKEKNKIFSQIEVSKPFWGSQAVENVLRFVRLFSEPMRNVYEDKNMADPTSAVISFYVYCDASSPFWSHADMFFWSNPASHPQRTILHIAFLQFRSRYLLTQQMGVREMLRMADIHAGRSKLSVQYDDEQQAFRFLDTDTPYLSRGWQHLRYITRAKCHIIAAHCYTKAQKAGLFTKRIENSNVKRLLTGAEEALVLASRIMPVERSTKLLAYMQGRLKRENPTIRLYRIMDVDEDNEEAVVTVAGNECVADLETAERWLQAFRGAQKENEGILPPELPDASRMILESGRLMNLMPKPLDVIKVVGDTFEGPIPELESLLGKYKFKYEDLQLRLLEVPDDEEIDEAQ